MATENRKDCDNCKYLGQPSYEWPCTVCVTAYGSEPSKWESIVPIPTYMVKVVHGEWSTIEDDYCGLVALHCSVCNQEWWFEEDAPIKHYHYCPNCGAKMDGDGNG